MQRLARQRLRKQRRIPPDIEPVFQIAPMIDVLLMMLVFFMTISSAETLQRSHGITLPAVSSARAMRNAGAQITVNIAWRLADETGIIFIDGARYSTASQVIARVRQTLRNNPGARILVRADQTVRWDFMKTILRAIGEAGATNVTFAVTNQKTTDLPSR